jgi:hypothetical protein
VGNFTGKTVWSYRGCDLKSPAPTGKYNFITVPPVFKMFYGNNYEVVEKTEIFCP